MAITNHYVTTTGSDTYANSTVIGTPCSLSTALTALTGGAAAAGDRIYLKAGAYTQRSATDTITTDGTLVSPIIIEGYNVTPGDLNTPTYNADGSLDTTNYPVIDYAATFRMAATGSDYIVWRNIKITGAGAGVSAALLQIGAQCVAHQCYVANPSTNASAVGITMGTQSIVENCDVLMAGASGTLAGILGNSAHPRVIASRILDAPGAGILFTTGTSHCVALDNVFFAAVVGPCIDATGNTGTLLTLRGNTCQGKATAVRVGAFTYTTLPYFGDNHITDCTTGILSLQDGTSQLAGWFSHNRFRDNTANVDGFDDWKTGGSAGEITTDTGGATTDYTDTTTNKYGLIAGAPGVKQASVPNRDIGAVQTPTYTPTEIAAQVWSTAGRSLT
jgi:hypothetical protein